MSARWTAAEDRVVAGAVSKYGPNQWSRVASLLPRRSAAQCHERWLSTLDPRLSHADWTAEEDALLRQLARHMPNMWRAVAASMPRRTAEQCHTRYVQLGAAQGEEGEPGSGVGPPSDAESDVDDASLAQDAQMLAEANARLTNSLGRRAKRKQRERREEMARFEERVAKHRKEGTRLEVAEVSTLPVLGLNLDGRAIDTAPAATRAVRVRRTLELSPVQRAGQPLAPVSELQRQRVRLQLQKMPPPNGVTL